MKIIELLFLYNIYHLQCSDLSLEHLLCTQPPDLYMLYNICTYTVYILGYRVGRTLYDLAYITSMDYTDTQFFFYLRRFSYL